MNSEENKSVLAQNILRFLVGFLTKDDERIAWKNVIKELNDIKPKEELLAELTKGVKSTVQYIINQVPKTKSPLLNEKWIK